MIRLTCNLNPFFRNACVSAYCNWWWRRCHTIWTKWRGIWIRGFKYDGWWPVSLHVHLFCKSRMNVLFKRRFAKFLCLFTSLVWHSNPAVTVQACKWSTLLCMRCRRSLIQFPRTAQLPCTSPSRKSMTRLPCLCPDLESWFNTQTQQNQLWYDTYENYV